MPSVSHIKNVRNYFGKLYRYVVNPKKATTTPTTCIPPKISTKPFVLSHVSGGLCNQLMCYAASCRIAEKKNCPIIAYSSNFTATDHTRWMLDAYPHRIFITTDWGELIRTLDIPAPQLPYEKLFDEQDKPVSLPTFKSFEKNLLQQHISVVDFNLALYYFRSDNDNYRPSQEILRDLTPKPELLSAYTLELEKKIAGQENAVAIHVRRGDFLDASNDLEIRPEYYIRAIEIARGRYPNCPLYVFSDDYNWCNSKLAHFDNLTLVTTPPQNSAVEDLYLASKCRHFILSNHSTFSHWMTELRTLRDSNLIIANSKAWLKTSRTIDWYYTPRHCTVI